MVDREVKERLLEELGKTGNIFAACAKCQIARCTYYRWIENKSFAKRAKKALDQGRENMVDIAEHALLVNVKKGDMRAIIYALSHNSMRYRGKKEDTKVLIVHEKRFPKEKDHQYKSLAGLIIKANKYDGKGIRKEL